MNLQLLDKYGILPGISPAEQYGQVEKAFRELDARLVRMTGRQPCADDLFDSLKRKEAKAPKRRQKADVVPKPDSPAQTQGRKMKR